MPRGRRGLSLVQPEEVRAKIGIYSDEYVAAAFGVCARTVRRWKVTGLPLYYGRRHITRDEWNDWVPGLARKPGRRRGQVSGL